MRPTKTAAATWYGRLAKATSHAAGRPMAFVSACGIVVFWASLGPLFGFSAVGLRLTDALLGFLYPLLHLFRRLHHFLQGRNAKCLRPLRQ